MSERGADFLLGWVDAHIATASMEPSDDKIVASAKAEECLADAGSHGISRAEIEAEVGNLADYLHMTMTRPVEPPVIEFRPPGEEIAPASGMIH